MTYDNRLKAAIRPVDEDPMTALLHLRLWLALQLGRRANVPRT